MTPLRLSHIWHRRLYVAIFLIALSLVTIYGLDYFGVYSVREMLQVNTLTALLAGVVVLASAVFFTIEKKLSGFGYSFSVFVVLTSALGWQIAQTDGITSPYLILWASLSLFAALFGAYGWVFMTVLIGIFVGGAYLSGDLDFETMTIITLSSILPLVTQRFYSSMT